jgi:ribose 5-phosphate isomerase B
VNQISDSELQSIIKDVLSRNLEKKPEGSSISLTRSQTSAKVVAIGSDHGGFTMKEVLISELKTDGYEVIDCGTFNQDACDYPDFALEVAKLVNTGKAWRGVMIDGAGIGSCMVANKVPHVRAAMCYDLSSAMNSREHNDANLLTLGAGLIGTSLAKQILKTWLSTEFGGGRHAKRVDKIVSIEQQFLKG